MQHDPRFDRDRRSLWEALRARGVSDDRVFAALAAVPRERFVPADLFDRAYENSALPIAAGQTISQPLMVAAMTQELGLRGGEAVLEIGTGSGYQTALLAELARNVVTIERVPELAASARRLLESLGYRNISYHIGDGSLGWPPAAPYDAIIVTAGAPDYPAPLYKQLALRPAGHSGRQRGGADPARGDEDGARPADPRRRRLPLRASHRGSRVAGRRCRCLRPEIGGQRAGQAGLVMSMTTDLAAAL